MTSATAPRSTASGAKSWPSRVKPGTQKNSAPGVTLSARVREGRDLDLGRPSPHQVAKGHGFRQVISRVRAARVPCRAQSFVQVADTESVSGTVLSALARLAERRFTSFSEAADTVLDLLEAELPPGSILLGRVDWDEGELRLIDVRGAAASALSAGSTLPLAPGANGGEPTASSTRRRSSGCRFARIIALPLDSSSGRRRAHAVRARIGHGRLQQSISRSSRWRAASSPTSGRA